MNDLAVNHYFLFLVGTCVLNLAITLVISHRRTKNEIKNLNQALTKISGNNPAPDSASNLYLQLELQIAQKEHFYKELQASHTNLEEEREMNEILIRTISHDLANPLTVIAAYTEMLHQGKISPEESEKIWARVKVNTMAAMDMIGRIRNAILTRTQASLVDVHKVSMHRAIKRVSETFESRLREKNLRLVVQNHLSPEVFVLGEENALSEHIFANILSNAIKFSYPGSEIHILITEIEEGVEIVFRDFGTGIQSNRLEKKLLKSTQGTSGETGTGFGLMVMGYFLRKFDASIEMISQTEGPQKGTTITLKLKKALENNQLKRLSDSATV